MPVQRRSLPSPSESSAKELASVRVRCADSPASRAGALCEKRAGALCEKRAGALCEKRASAVSGDVG